jgi:hypothetical protein
MNFRDCLVQFFSQPEALVRSPGPVKFEVAWIDPAAGKGNHRAAKVKRKGRRKSHTAACHSLEVPSGSLAPGCKHHLILDPDP